MCWEDRRTTHPVNCQWRSARDSSEITSISCLKVNVVRTVRDIAGQRAPLVNIRNGTAKAIHDVACDEATMALLEILAIGNQQVAQGRARPVAEVVKRLRVQFRRTADREG